MTNDELGISRAIRYENSVVAKIKKLDTHGRFL